MRFAWHGAHTKVIHIQAFWDFGLQRPSLHTVVRPEVGCSDPENQNADELRAPVNRGYMLTTSPFFFSVVTLRNRTNFGFNYFGTLVKPYRQGLYF